MLNQKKSLVICKAGYIVEYLEETEIAKSMRCIMLKARLNNVGFYRCENGNTGWHGEQK